MSEWKDKLEGKAKELKGKVTGDRLEELKGKAQEARGEAKGKVNDLRDALKNRRTAEHSDADEVGSPLPGEGVQAGEGQPVE